MQKFTLDLPSMFGDHHVVAVRRLLFELEGVEQVYASSGFRFIEVDFDETKVSPEDMKSKLDEAGYLEDSLVAVESGLPATELGNKAVFRHTQAYENTQKTVSFSQTVSSSSKGLWPCPGMGPIRTMEE